ncbi:phage tail family protein [Bacillus sp. 1P02SD]|uniref:phage tail family protein n=1 Tax=Bacillus sp. 1P02SD TaxID=3132264 RepID=UPI0039A2F514
MNLIQIWDMNNVKIDVSKYGLMGLKLNIPSPSYEVTRENIDGRPGAVTLGRNLSPRPLNAEFLVTAKDYADSLLLRDELFSLFSKGNQFYIGEVYQPGKRWFVECTTQWDPERLNTENMTIDIPLIAESGMAESVGTTLDPFTFDTNLWQIGQGLLADELKYNHSVGVFDIYNAGEKIDPRYMDLVIEYKGASTNLTIKNETTGDEWIYTGTSSSSDVIKLNGVRSEKNGLSIFRNTNKRLITLNPGWNGFRLTGTSGTFEISFKFRFYYL